MKKKTTQKNPKQWKGVCFSQGKMLRIQVIFRRCSLLAKLTFPGRGGTGWARALRRSGDLPAPALRGHRRKHSQQRRPNVTGINLSICLAFSGGPPRIVNEAHALPRKQP